MFLAPDGKTYEPFKIRTEKRVITNGEDTAMEGAGDEVEEEVEYPDDDEGAIYPLKGMRIILSAICKLTL
jgi:actin-related protein 9